MTIVTLEEYTCRTWPALETIPYDGWLLRFAEGCTNRANAVYPLYRSTYEIDRKIDYCAHEYAARGLRPTFKMTDASSPPALDRALESAGYTVFEPSLVMTAPLSSAAPAVAAQVALTETFFDAWIDAYFEFQPSRIHQRDTYKRLFTATPGQRAFASVQVEGRIVAVGLVSRSRDIAGIYNMATHPDFRGNGYAEAVVRALQQHAFQHGAHRAILSVSAANAVAQRVYARCGFTEAYRYWYRVGPQS